jgi:hypothetical protein
VVGSPSCGSRLELNLHNATPKSKREAASFQEFSSITNSEWVAEVRSSFAFTFPSRNTGFLSLIPFARFQQLVVAAVGDVADGLVSSLSLKFG